jgi:hypothetical protein
MYKWVCPVCGSKNIGEFSRNNVCYTCEWEQDAVQENDPTYSGGANDLCLNDYKKEWENSKRKKSRDSVNDEPFDYTEWSQNLYEDMTPDELTTAAVNYARENPQLIPENARVI